MSFADSLAPYSAAVIVAALGCPRQTAYAWLDGSRKPPEWQQQLFLTVITREAKKHNKTLHGIPARRAVRVMRSYGVGSHVRARR